MAARAKEQTRKTKYTRENGYIEWNGQIWGCTQMPEGHAHLDILRRVKPGKVRRDPHAYGLNAYMDRFHDWAAAVPKNIAVISEQALRDFLDDVMRNGAFAQIGGGGGEDGEEKGERKFRKAKPEHYASLYPFICGNDEHCDYLFDARGALYGLGELRTREVAFCVDVHHSQTALVMRSKSAIVAVRGIGNRVNLCRACPTLMTDPPRVMAATVRRLGCSAATNDYVKGRRLLPRGFRR